MAEEKTEKKTTRKFRRYTEEDKKKVTQLYKDGTTKLKELKAKTGIGRKTMKAWLVDAKLYFAKKKATKDKKPRIKTKPATAETQTE